jgi:hypothetical protein
MFFLMFFFQHVLPAFFVRVSGTCQVPDEVHLAPPIQHGLNDASISVQHHAAMMAPALQCLPVFTSLHTARLQPF